MRTPRQAFKERRLAFDNDMPYNQRTLPGSWDEYEQPSFLFRKTCLRLVYYGRRILIISASRRTDIPAYYAGWFMACIRAGFCDVPNPYQSSQVTRVDLRPEAVDAIVFWTRNPGPLMPYLDELDNLGYRYYFQYTILDNPRPLEKRAPTMAAGVKTFTRLAERIGAARLIWRYDPILFTPVMDSAFHMKAYERISNALRGCTRRSVVSIMNRYRKSEKRFAQLEKYRLSPYSNEDKIQAQIDDLMPFIVSIARKNGMEITSCAEDHDISVDGIKAGKCVDDDLLREVFGIEVNHAKDPNQRAACLCRLSKDIGQYDTCLSGCAYCYATRDFSQARQNYLSIHTQAWKLERQNT